MRIVDLMMLVRADVQLRIERTAGMKFYSNGDDVTDAIKCMDLVSTSSRAAAWPSWWRDGSDPTTCSSV